MNRKDLLGAAILLLIAGAYYWATLRIPFSTLDDGVGPRGFPLVLTVALVIVATALAVRAVTRVPAGIRNQDDAKEVEAGWPQAQIPRPRATSISEATPPCGIRSIPSISRPKTRNATH